MNFIPTLRAFEALPRAVSMGRILHHMLGPSCSFFSLISVVGLPKKRFCLTPWIFPKLL